MGDNENLTEQIEQVLALHTKILKLAEGEKWESLLGLCQERFVLCQKIFRHENYESLQHFKSELKQIKNLDVQLMESFKPIFAGSIKKIYANKKQLQGCREYRNSYSVK